MSIIDDFDTIEDYAHMWNWVPDWEIARRIYQEFPESYSVLTPFAYSYLEELIRSTTPEYGIPPYDLNGKPTKIRVGMALIKYAIEENSEKSEYIKLLEKAKKHFSSAVIDSEENGRNRVMHGHTHPRFWSQEMFETLIHEIAELSPYAGF